MTAALAMAAAPPVQNGTDWIVPPPLIGKLLPGDQVVWTRSRGIEIHEIVALITLAGVPVAILRKADPKPAAPDAARTFATFAVTAAHGEFRLTIVEPLSTDRVWMVTDTQILLTQRTDQ